MAMIPEIQQLLEWLRDPSKNENPEISTFEDLLPEALKRLNLPDGTNLVSLEAFLIQAAYTKFPTAKESKKRDACLMDLGLLKCCYHTVFTDGIGNASSPASRQASYLAYVNSESHSLLASMSGLDVEISKPDNQGALEKRARDNRAEFAQHLQWITTHAKECTICLENGMKKFVTVDEGGNQIINLPEPSVRLKKPKINPPKQAPHETESISIDSAIEREQNRKKNEEKPQLGAVENSQQAPYQKTDSMDSISRNFNENVIKNSGNDSHDMNIQIKYYIYSPQEVSPDSGVMERDPPSIEYSDPEPELTSQYYLVEKDSSIGERVGQFFVKVKNWYCKQSKKTQKSKKAKMTKKAKTTLIIAGAAIPAIILVIIFFNMNVPTSPPRTSSTGSQRSSLLDTSSNDSEFLENQLIVTSEDMQEIINEARSSIEVLDESGEYDVESIKDLIFYRIVYNPIYGDMVVRGFWEADSFMQDKIGEGHPQLADFVSESSAALGENEPDTFIPDMSHWLIKISNQISTTDNYKEYARFLCAMLENSFSEIRVDNFDSTSHWSIGGDAEGISVHAELVERSSNQPAIIFENIGDGNQLRYQVAFFLKDGSFATCNPWVQQSRSRDNPGQERPSYTIEEVENGVLGDKIVFNSISDGVFGDEKNFVSARPEDNPDGYEGNDITVENGKEYIVRLYVHNNSPKGEEAIAEDVRVAFALPKLNAYAKDHQINGFITSSNATPGEYWDYINFHSDTCFKLTYVPGSARINNNSFANKDAYEESKTLSNSIIKTLDDPDGVLIGYKQFADGEIPGCFQYDQVVYIRVKAEYPDFMIQQQVRLVGEEEWKYEVDAEIGDEVEFRIEYKNIDDEEKMHKDVMIKDIMPEGLCYLGGSTMLYNVNHPDGVTIDQDSLVYTGINIGRYATGANGVVFFKARVVDESLEYGSNALVNWALGGVGYDTLSDYAVVMVNKE